MRSHSYERVSSGCCRPLPLCTPEAVIDAEMRAGCFLKPRRIARLLLFSTRQLLRGGVLYPSLSEGLFVLVNLLCNRNYLL